MPHASPDDALTVIDNLRERSPVPETGLGHTTVLNHPDMRIVILTFSSGHTLKEHSAPFPLLMQALDGELCVRADGIDTTLKPGGLIRMNSGLRHEVEARSASRLMLTLFSR